MTMFNIMANPSAGEIDLTSLTNLQQINNYGSSPIKVNANKLTAIMTSSDNITFVGEGNTITIYTDTRKYKFFRTKIYNV